MVQIIFNDGTILECEMNGSTFLVDEKPTFMENLTDILIKEVGTDENGTETETEIAFIKNGLVVECYTPEEKYAFTIIEKPYTQVLEEKLAEMARVQEEQDEVIAEILETL